MSNLKLYNTLSKKKEIFNSAYHNARGENIEKLITSLAINLQPALLELGAEIGISELRRELRTIADMHGQMFIRNVNFLRKVIFVKFDIYSN